MCFGLPPGRLAAGRRRREVSTAGADPRLACPAHVVQRTCRPHWPGRKEADTMEERTPLAGKVVALWRYPIKSMQGEQLPVALLAQGSLLGDRAFALLDCATGLVASAKHPGRWSRLLACQAAFVEPPTEGVALPPVRVTLPDGTSLLSARPDVNP